MEALDRFKQMFRFLWNKFDMIRTEILDTRKHTKCGISKQARKGKLVPSNNS